MQRVLEPEVMDTAEEAKGYDAMDHGPANAAFVARLVELNAKGRMLDIGCGPGHIALLVCERLPAAQVVAVDLALHMLAFAERHVAASPHKDRVDLRHADAKALPFPDGSFDAVFSNTILHHIPDPRLFLKEARRVLRPGGALLIRDLFRPPTAERAAELTQLHAADATPYQQELLRASLCAALTPEELRKIANEAGLRKAELVTDSDRHMSLQIAAES
jgi:ubiquinone/menaquinone biosynthesis C-methylase UbiE